MKLTEDQMEAIMDGVKTDFSYKKIEQSEWEDEGKFQSCEVIFECDGKFYSFSPTRSGDYWSGYELGFYDDEAVEVEQREVITYAWVPVEQKEEK